MIYIARFILTLTILLDFCLTGDVSGYEEELPLMIHHRKIESPSPELMPINISDDMWAEVVFPYLDLEDYARLSGVSKYFYDFLRGEKYISGIILRLMSLYCGIIPLLSKNNYLSPEDERDLLCRIAVPLNYLKINYQQQLEMTESQRKFESNCLIMKTAEEKFSSLPYQMNATDFLIKMRDHYMSKNRALYESPECKFILVDLYDGELPPVTSSSVFQRLIKNKRFMVSAAVGIAIGCMGGGLYYLLPYPDYFQSLGHTAGLEAYEKMMNTTYLSVGDEVGFFSCCVDPHSPPNFFQNIPVVMQTHYAPQWEWRHYHHENGYVFYNKTSRIVNGTLEDWVHFITSEGKCTYDFWIKYLYKLVNGTEGNLPNPHNMVCNPNSDNTSICCGNVWSPRSSKDFGYLFCDGSYCFRMIRGDAQQAYQETYFQTITRSFLIFAAIESCGVIGGLSLLALLYWGYHYYV